MVLTVTFIPSVPKFRTPTGAIKCLAAPFRRFFFPSRLALLSLLFPTFLFLPIGTQPTPRNRRSCRGSHPHTPPPKPHVEHLLGRGQIGALFVGRLGGSPCLPAHCPTPVISPIAFTSLAQLLRGSAFASWVLLCGGVNRTLPCTHPSFGPPA